jgi:hypothetical protein
MIKSNAGQPRGLLNLKAGEKKFQLSRHLPAEDLRFFVQHSWIVTWDLRGQEPYLQENLSHPSVHLVLEKDKSRIVGVVKGKFSRILENQGRVFGIKFKPGAFYPFVKSPVSKFTNRMISPEEIFGVDLKVLEGAILLLAISTKEPCSGSSVNTLASAPSG